MLLLLLACDDAPKPTDTADADTDTDTDTDSDADTDSDTDTDTDSDTDADSDTDTDTDSDTDTDTGPLTLTPDVGRVFTSLATGGEHVCAIQDDGAVRCSGLDAPTGTFVEVTAGAGFSCGLSTDGALSCWGEDMYEWGMTTPPEGTYTSMAGGLWTTCAIGDDGSVVCWGRYPTTQPGPYVDTAVGYAYACGLDDAGTLSCWGEESAVYLAKATDDGLVGPWSDIQGGAFLCGTTDGDSTCWTPYEVQTWTNARVYSGAAGVCTLDTAGTPDCRELDYDRSLVRPLDAPDTMYEVLSVGEVLACGIEPDGGVSCWALFEEVDWTE